jgi:hypothetical protein
VDLVTVLKHALAARRRHLVRDALLVLSIVVGVGLGIAIPGGFLIILPLAWLVIFVEQLTTQSILARSLKRDSFDPARAPEPATDGMRRRLAEIGQRDRGNATVYESFSPFVGYGLQLEDAWSFVLDVGRPAANRTATPFTVHELYDAVARELATIELPGLGVEQRVFVSGQDLLDLSDPQMARELLPQPLAAPLATMTAGQVRHVVERPEGRARSYLAARVTGWSGELALTTFLRFALSEKAKSLYVEASYCLLAPVRPAYRSVDQMRESPTVGQFVRVAGHSAAFVPVRLVTCWVGVSRFLGGPLRRWSKWRNDRRAILHERTHNYGPAVRPRELASDNHYYRYFQKQDKEMYNKVVEWRLMRALNTFLESHGVDTYELTQRQTQIVNSGIIFNGDANITASTLAAGAGAMARTLNRATSLVPGRGAGRTPTP